jgi:tetratricopeptide (TPR) repeat protein
VNLYSFSFLKRLLSYVELRLYLGRLDEAQAVLNQCLQVYKHYDDLTMQSKTLTALANVWQERGNMPQAIALERQALAICERLDDPQERAISHGNLANYLFTVGDYSACAAHRLAALIYHLVTGNQRELMRELNNHAIDTKAVHANYRLPSVQDLITLAEFSALRQFLHDHQVPITELQVAIDAAVKQTTDNIP